jgi:hypothetical protein
MTSHIIHANNYACVVLLLAVFRYEVNQFNDLYLVVAFMPINTHVMSYYICYTCTNFNQISKQPLNRRSTKNG